LRLYIILLRELALISYSLWLEVALCLMLNLFNMVLLSFQEIFVPLHNILVIYHLILVGLWLEVEARLLKYLLA
jgi:hypothetical protein